MSTVRLALTTFISIHALRGEGDADVVVYCQREKDISIHALRGEGDYNLNHIEKPYFISIHALRGEGDNKIDTCNHKTNKFQSTPSVGRATFIASTCICAP